MKLFENKSIFKKLLSFFVVTIIAFSAFSGSSQAKDDDEGIGGKLLKPVVDLVVSLGDGAYNILHHITINQEDTLITVHLLKWYQKLWNKIKTVIVFVVIALVVAVAIVASAGAVGAALAAIGLGAGLASISAGTVILVAGGAGLIGASIYKSNALPNDKYFLPMYSFSAEEIFSNKLQLFDVDFFHPKETITYSEEVSRITGVPQASVKKVMDDKDMDDPDISSAKLLRITVGKWYENLRDLALVVSLSVLVYTGIRIMISSTSKDQAKYKQMLIDWVVALCLIFIMQYIMTFANFIVKKFTDLVATTNYENQIACIIPDTGSSSNPDDGAITKTLKTDYDYDPKAIDDLYVKDGNGNILKDEDGNNLLYWKTNLIGVARLNAQMNQNVSSAYAGYAIIFVVMIMMTVFFVITYLKRVLYMAFLTIISPLVAMTYPIDKMNDGSAQAFNMWFKEYVFNLLIQPFHLLLYTVLISSAFELASKNILYGLVALGFMVPAEKLLRKFFGFEKAQTAGVFEGAAGAGAAMALVNRMTSKASGGKLGSGNSDSGRNSSDDDSNIRYNDIDRDSLFGDNGTPNSAPGSSGNSDQDGELGGNRTPSSPNTSGGTRIPGASRGSTKRKEPRTIGQWLHDGVYNGVQTGINKASSGVSNVGKKLIVNPAKSLDKKIAGTRVGGSKPIRALRKTGLKSARSIGAGTKYYAKGMANKLTEKAKNMHPLKNSIRFAGGAVGAATLGAVGLAAGIASGDPSKALQYTIAAGAGGAKLGASVGSAVTVEDTKEAIDKGYYGEDEYKLRQVEKKYNELNNDKNFMKQLTDQFGSEEQAKTAMEEVGLDAISYGFTDAKEIAAIYKATSLEGLSTEKAIQTLDYVKTLGKDTSMLGNKDSQDLNDTLIRKVHTANPNKGSGEVADQAGALRKSFDRMSQFYFQGRKK